MPARINVTMSDQNYEELKQEAMAVGMDMSEYVRTAIRLLHHIQREKKNGRKLYIGRDAKVEQEVVLP